MREPPDRSTAALRADEILIATYFPAGSATGAFYALNPCTGVARRLSEALPDTALKPLARILGGRWILVQQQRYRHRQLAYRLYGYYILQGRFYPVTDWGPLRAFGKYTAGPADQLLLDKSPAIAYGALMGLFAGKTRDLRSLPSLGNLTSEIWLLRLDEKRLLPQAPVNSEE